MPPVFCVTQSGRDDVPAAPTARVTLQPEISLLVIPLITVDNLDKRMQRPRARPPFTNLFAARRQCHQVTPSMTARFQTAPVRDIVNTERDKQLLTDLRRDSAMAIPRCIASRYATAWAENLEGAISGHQSWAVLCRYRCRLRLRCQKALTIETSATALGDGRDQ